MKELSLNVLDIAMNSVKARASLVKIEIDELEETLSITISDNGCGMKQDFLESVTNPFCTTRTTRNVGLGIPLLKLAAEQTGGSIEITSVCETDSPDSHGTTVTAVFFKNHLDFTPLGDVVSSVTVLIQGSPDIDWKFVHTIGNESVELDTKELREVLGDVPLDSYEVIKWIEDFLKESYESVS